MQHEIGLDEDARAARNNAGESSALIVLRPTELPRQTVQGRADLRFAPDSGILWIDRRWKRGNPDPRIEAKFSECFGYDVAPSTVRPH